MDHFKQYSKYYDLIYKDKDYVSEVSYLIDILNKLGKKNCNLLDIGCGTGKHANLLIKKGFAVDGIDISETMLEAAVSNYGSSISFETGDIRNFRINKSFDVITALFHVMSYQVTNEDLDASFKSVYSHLNPDGYFVFDCWYGPGVMNNPPTIKIKRINDSGLEIIRISEPVIDYVRSVVDVNYQIIVNDLKNKSINTFYEKHPMRYLFKNEIEFLAEKYMFKFKSCYAWMTFNEPTRNDWYAVFILQK